MKPQFDAALSAVIQRADGLAQQYAAIADAETYQKAADAVRMLAEYRKQVLEFFQPMKQAAHKAHAAIVARERMHLEPIDHVNTIVRRSMVAYDAQERARREEAQRVAAAEAKAAEEDHRLNLAVRMSEAGVDETTIDEILAAPLDTGIMPVTAPPSPDGIHYQVRYRAEVVDAEAFVRAVAAGRIPLDAIVINQTWLNRQARQLRETMQYPGVRVHAERHAVVRGSGAEVDVLL